MTGFQRSLLITIAATFILVVIGGTVRATESGLGCPDWPLCHGQIIPPADKHAIIEFTHRWVASIVGFLFLGVTFFAFKTERRNPLVFWLAFTAGLLLIVQIGLGAVTVLQELPPEIVAAHLLTAMTFLGIMLTAACISIARSRGWRVRPPTVRSSFTRMAVAAAGATLATLVVGAYISGTEAALGCDGWPLCSGQVVPTGDSAEALHFLHRVVAAVLGLLVLATIYLAFEQRRRQPALLGLSLFAGATYLAQVFVGAANIWTSMATIVIIAHLSLAALMWSVMVVLAVLSYYLPGAEAEAAAEDEVKAGSPARNLTEWA